MPGPVSDSYEGPSDEKPEPPDWAFMSPELLQELTNTGRQERRPIGDTPPEVLEGFSKNGLHVGSARYFYRTGRWQVTLTGVLDETAARRILQAFGAVTIHAESGMK